jgi:hypothetical protein
LQENFIDLAVSGLASMYPAFRWSISLRAIMDIIWGKAAAPPREVVRQLMSSGPEEFHLRALPDPYVNLSIHTAPVVRPLP